MKKVTILLFWIFLFLGVKAAYEGNMEVALFFAITCAGESIARSIDYWPRLREKGKKKRQPVPEKEIRKLVRETEDEDNYEGLMDDLTDK